MTTTNHTTRPSTPLLLRAAEAAAWCGISLRSWRQWDADGRIPGPVKIAHSAFWRVSELQAWIAAGCPDRVTWQRMQN